MGNNSEWSFGSWKDSNALGKHVEDFIWENPEWGIYLRKDHNFTCTEHWDPASATPKANIEYCPNCLGLGIKTTSILVPTRVNLGIAKLARFETDLRVEPGFTNLFYTAIDFPRNANPKKEDLIMFCEWDRDFQTVQNRPTARPIRVASIYVLKSDNPHVERQLSWIQCGAESYEYNLQWADSLLKNLTNLNVLKKETTSYGW